MLAVISPAEASNQKSNNDIIPGGVTSIKHAFKWCSENEEIRVIYAQFGVSCDAINSGTVVPLNSRDHNSKLYSLGRQPYSKQGEYPVRIGNSTFYMRPLWSWDTGASSKYQAIKGTRTNGTTFYILFDCGNVVIIDEQIVEKPKQHPPVIVNVGSDCSTIFGDAYDSDTNNPIQIHIYYDSDYNASSHPAPDVTTSTRGGQPPGAHTRFTVPISMGGKDTRSFWVYALGQNTAGARDGEAVYKSTSGPCNKQQPKCPYDATINQTDSRCKPCPYNGSIIASNPSCKELCPYNNTIAKTDPKCERCPYPGLTGISKVDPNCKELCPYNQTIYKDSPLCKPCDKSQNQTDSSACVELRKKASNTTQNVSDADGTTASGGDVITYVLSAKNTGKVTVKDFVVEENIGDILDYADVTDLHGGDWDKKTNIVKWPKADLPAGATTQKQLTVKIKNPIPQTPVSTSNPGSNDLVMTNVYGNTVVNIKLPPSIVKTTEQVTTTLPSTGPGTSIMIGFVVTSIIGYFFARARLFATELDIIRSEYAQSGAY